MKRLKVRGQPCPQGQGTHKPSDTSLSVVPLPSPLPQTGMKVKMDAGKGVVTIVRPDQE